MENKIFHTNDLRPCDWQHTVRWNKTSKFVCGEKVFLKSNPEHPMIVHNIKEDTITTIWKDVCGDTQCHEFIPECILQYEYAALVTGRRIFHVCLN